MLYFSSILSIKTEKNEILKFWKNIQLLVIEIILHLKLFNILTWKIFNNIEKNFVKK